MTKRQTIIHTLRQAIADGIQKTRKEWAWELHVQYEYFSKIVRWNLLQAAIAPVRAEHSAGTVKVSSRYPTDVHARLPAVALRAAGLQTWDQLHYQSLPGKIIVTAPILTTENTETQRGEGR